MKVYKYIIFASFLLCIFDMLKAQERVIQGIVLDGSVSEEAALPGVYITVKGTSQVNLTDNAGNFSIKVKTGDILIFSSMGYLTEEVLINDQQSLKIILTPDIVKMAEVVVVGYGTQSKKEVITSISTVNADQLTKTSVSGLDQALQGRAAGVSVTSNSGAPGGSVSVKIRGVGSFSGTDPLYVIDGVPFINNNAVVGGGAVGTLSGSALSALNPNDIESITILKDASSGAIYGARAANGVVLITTKRGKSGKGKIEFSSYGGFQDPVKMIDMLSAEEYFVLQKEAWTNSGLPVKNLPQEFKQPASSFGSGTNWQKALFRRAYIQNHQISAAGGNEKINFFSSLNYMDQDGIILGSDFQRISARFNADCKINEKLKVGNNLSFSQRTESQVLNNSPYDGVVANALKIQPFLPVYNDDGSFTGPNESYYGTSRNPVASVTKNKFDNKLYQIIGNIFAEFKLCSSLTFRTSLGMNNQFTDNRSFTPKYAEGNLKNSFSTAGKTNMIAKSWLTENTLNFNKVIGNHNINALAGITAESNRLEALSGSGRDSTDLLLRTRIVDMSGQLFSVSNFISESTLLSQFLRINYNYSSKYLFAATVRRDGSSRFGSNNRYGIFPSFSVGWRISEEEFAKNIQQISDLKLKAAWGQVGSDQIGDYSFVATLSDRFYPFGNPGNLFVGKVLNQIPNPFVTWETATTSNIGFDLGLYNGKITLAADYYYNKRTDMLLSLPATLLNGILDESSGSSSVSAGAVDNVGELSNSGIELTLGYRKSTGDFQYNLNFNFTTIRNKILSLGPNEYTYNKQATFNSEFITRSEVGQPLGYFFGWKTDGIFRDQFEINEANSRSTVSGKLYQPEAKPGDIRFMDIDGNGYIDDKDRTFLGSPIPKITGGFTSDFSYKNFDLSVFVQYVYGNKIFNLNRALYESTSQTFNKGKSMLNRWTPDNFNSDMPRLDFLDPNRNDRASDRWIEDGSFVRVKSVQFGYNLPEKFNQVLKVSKLRVYISGQNLITFTKYNGYDPEVGSMQPANDLSGIDASMYPQSRTFLLGFNLSF